MSDTARYILLHSEEELRRLEHQGAFLRPATRDFLRRAGLEPGMRVLDVGSGMGDVSFLAAELVGPTGEVVGVDHSEVPVSQARARAHAKRLENVRFVHGGFDALEDLAGERRFDAVVGRLVLVHHPDPVAAVDQLVRLLRPGGVIAFHEIDLDAKAWSTHPLPALQQLWAWVDVVARHGRFSGGLASAFLTAFDRHGLVDRNVTRTGAVENAHDSGVYAWVAGFVRTLVPAVRGLGVDVGDVDLDGYQARLMAEVRESGANFVPVHFLGASARVPHAG